MIIVIVIIIMEADIFMKRIGESLALKLDKSYSASLQESIC